MSHSFPSNKPRPSIWHRLGPGTLRAAAILLNLLLLALLVLPAHAGNHAPFSARAGYDIARDAALTWAPDARLVYLENDESLIGNGTTPRWGYLFHSASKGKARGYSVRDGKILEATDLDFDFEAPPIPDGWVDSGKAIESAERKAGSKYRREHAGRLSTMLLIRGAFHEDKPNATTWTLLYTSNAEPALFVVVDAANGKVVRTWRG